MKKAVYNEQKNLFIITFNKNDFTFALSIVRDIPGRKYEMSYWTCPVNTVTYNILYKSGFDIILGNNFPLKIIETKNISKIIKNHKKIDRSLLKGLRDYQIEGVQFIEDNNGNGIIGDDMGTGKTIQAIGYIKLHPELYPILIVCPSFLKINWKREIYKWLGIKSIILNSRNPYYIKGKIYIINYEILSYWYIFIKGNFHPQLIIVDECQYIKNYKAKRTKALIKLIKDKMVKSRILLSGTPIENRPSEFFTALNIIDPVTFNSMYTFLNRYCGPIIKGMFTIYNGLSNWKELRELIEPIMIRRKKSDILKELPEKIISIVELDTTKKEMDEYKKEFEDFKNWANNVENLVKMVITNRMEMLKQLAYCTKRAAVFKWIENFLESNEKLVIFAYHRKVIDDICQYFKCDKIDGSISMEKRQVIVDKFQNDKNVKILVGQIKAMGTGITLTASSNVVFIEFGWSPAEHTQAADRVHRIGQKNQVNIYYLVAFGTIEKDIVKMIQGKSEIVNKMLDGDENSKHFDMDILQDIFDRMKNKK